MPRRVSPAQPHSKKNRLAKSPRLHSDSRPIKLINELFDCLTPAPRLLALKFVHRDLPLVGQVLSGSAEKQFRKAVYQAYGLSSWHSHRRHVIFRDNQELLIRALGTLSLHYDRHDRWDYPKEICSGIDITRWGSASSNQAVGPKELLPRSTSSTSLSSPLAIMDDGRMTVELL